MRVKTNGSKGHFEGGEGLELHEVYEEVSGPGEILDQRDFEPKDGNHYCIRRSLESVRGRRDYR